jgi:hypothetical protein
MKMAVTFFFDDAKAGVLPAIMIKSHGVSFYSCSEPGGTV